MKVTCERCQTSYQIADGKVPLHGARANCPNCGGVILVLAPVGAPAEASGAAGSPAAPAPAPAAPALEKDFGKTISFDFSQVVQGDDEAADMLKEAKATRGVLHPGVTYSLRDEQTGETFPIVKPQFIIGRKGADVELSDPEVSRRHCEVKVMGDHLILVDLLSTNGTHVRGDKVKSARLTPGQSFTVGNTTLAFTAVRLG
jgi:predicted Zn finger-like uncharacterized protein